MFFVLRDGCVVLGWCGCEGWMRIEQNDQTRKRKKEKRNVKRREKEERMKVIGRDG